jgi:predicted O-linked N-acetylglucosamine transferase (SPINDLY family)
MAPIALLLQQACQPCLEGDFLEAGRLVAEAGDWVRRGSFLGPEDVSLWIGFGKHLAYMYALPDNWELLVRLLRTTPWDPATHSNLLLCQHFLPGNRPQDLTRLHRRWAQRHAWDVPAAAPFRQSRDPDRPLRVGYLSPDFRGHCVARFFEPLLQAHDRTRFRLFGYSHVPPQSRDAETGRLGAAFDTYRDIWGLSDAGVADLIRADAIDILVDLAGHSHHHRLTVFARTPAPVQVTYLGYPNTTGLAQMDYRLSDAVLDVPGRETPCTETIIRLENSFACYQAPAFAPAVADPPVLHQGAVTLGSFVGAAKHNPEVIALWSRVLHQVPEANLLLRFQRAEEGLIQQQCRKAFGRHGIDPRRIRFDGLRPPDEHLDQYRHIDIALDTVPWSSHTSACEALWMGVPVVSWAQDRAVSRMGASVLTHLGMSALVADSARRYVEIVGQLARDRRTLVQLRRSLRPAMSRSAVCDASRFTRNVESVYRKLWRDWLAAENICTANRH